MDTATVRESARTASGGTELFRMEKSVMTKANFDELSAVSGDRVPEALLQFICYEHQWNLFGYGRLDPAEFARLFRFSRSFLLGRHEDPYQLRLRRTLKGGGARNLRRRSAVEIPQEEILCTNRIENALFILANYALNVTSTSVQEDNTLVRRFGFLRVIESFSLVQDGRTGKIVYTYKLDDKFRRNLSSLYLTASRESLVSLRRSGLGALYVFLLRLRDALFAEGRTATLPDRTPGFDYLCSLASVPAYPEIKYRKRDLRRALAKVRESTELDFDVEWVRAGGRERYTPLFLFRPEGSAGPVPAESGAARARRLSERVDIAVLEFKHNLVETCPLPSDRLSPAAEDFFFAWIRRTDAGTLRMITFALEKTFVNIGSGIPGDIPARVRLFSLYAQSRGREGFDVWLRELFGGYHGFSVPGFRCIDGGSAGTPDA